MAWFDSFAQEYDDWYQTKLGGFVDKVEKKLIEDLAEFDEDEKVLDIGAGTGTYSIWMAKKGLKVTALDQSSEMMEKGKVKTEREGLTIDWKLADANSLPFSDNSFDLVVSVTAIEFMDHPKTVLKEAVRVLKPNGRLIIGVLTKESAWGELYQSIVEEDPKHLFAKAHFYSEDEISSLLPLRYVLKKGLYWPPIEEFTVEEAWLVEEQKQQEQADYAGFYVIRWDKE